MGVVKYAVVIALTAVALYYIRDWLRPKVPRTVHGSCKPPFERVRDVFRNNLESGAERGGAFSLYHQGQLVCDLWGGFADETIEYPWQEDTVSMYHSTTKAVAALCVMILVDRGLLDYEKPVADYWPDFSQNGKGNVTVKMLVSHQAGLAALDEEYSIQLLRGDSVKLGRILAAQAPNWPPGTMIGYHALTHGLYLDQLVRRADPRHRNLQEFFQEEVAEPYGIDFYIGIPKEEHYRVARFMDLGLLDILIASIKDPEAGKFMYKLMTGSDPLAKRAFALHDTDKISDYVHYWPEYRSLPFGSAFGYGGARGVAKLFGILSNDGRVKGQKPLLSAEVVPLINSVVTSGKDRVVGVNWTMGYGWEITQKWRRGHKTFGFSGYGGQAGWGDTHNKLGWGYVTNYPSLRMDDMDPRLTALLKAVYDVIEGK